MGLSVAALLMYLEAAAATRKGLLGGTKTARRKHTQGSRGSLLLLLGPRYSPGKAPAIAPDEGDSILSFLVGDFHTRRIFQCTDSNVGNVMGSRAHARSV